jgi:hypothetical protein
MKTACDRTTKQNAHLTFRGNVKKGRHGWLRLTPAYSLHVVEEILQKTSTREFVLDPFSGTGTTPLACSCLGVPCDAVDVNPFLVWFGKTKVTHYEASVSNRLREKADIILAAMSKSASSGTAWVPPLHQIEKWWDPATLNSLAVLCSALNQLAAPQDGGVDNLLRVAFCRVMIQTAHVSFGHQSMSFKKREPTFFETSAPEDWIRTGFLDSVDAIANNLQSENPQAEARFFCGDSRDLSKVLPKTNYSLVVTSPPYPNRMSYIRELRPYMYWLGYLTNGRQAGELDWNAIGGTWGCATSLLNRWEPESLGHFPFDKFSRIVGEIRQKHHALAQYVHRYFEDIKTHVMNLKKVLRKGSPCHYIVGNSKFYDTLVSVEQIYAALFEYAGFSNVRIQTLRKRNSKKELYEYLVYAEAPGQNS